MNQTFSLVLTCQHTRMAPRSFKSQTSSLRPRRVALNRSQTISQLQRSVSRSQRSIPQRRITFHVRTDDLYENQSERYSPFLPLTEENILHYLERLRNPDRIVIREPEIRIRFTKPDGTKLTEIFQSQGFTRANLYEIIADQYQDIYAEKEEWEDIFDGVMLTQMRYLHAQNVWEPLLDFESD